MVRCGALLSSSVVQTTDDERGGVDFGLDFDRSSCVFSVLFTDRSSTTQRWDQDFLFAASAPDALLNEIYFDGEYFLFLF